MFVTFETVLDIPVRPAEEGKDADKAGHGEGHDGEHSDEHGDGDVHGHGEGGDEQRKNKGGDEDGGKPPTLPAVAERITKNFFARSHLIVTVPIYARWQVLDWEDR